MTNVERSKRFYSELLGLLGWSSVLDCEGERLLEQQVEAA